MDITSLGLHITDQCARCLHCAFGCSPEIEGFMKLEEAKSM